MPEGSSLAPEQAPAPSVFRAVPPRRLRNRRLLIAGSMVVVAAGIVAAVALRSGQPAPMAPAADLARSALTVTLGPVGTKSMAESLLVVGSLVPWEDLTISSEAVGLTITQMLVDEGDHVTAGQLMAKLDDSVILAQLKANEAQIQHARSTIGQQDAAIAEAEANARSAQNDLKRGQELLRASNISVQTVEAREAASGSATARVQSARMGRAVAEADVAIAESQHAELVARLAQTEIRAPTDGIVSKRTARIGRVVIGAGSDELFHMVRDDILELDAEVPDRLLARVSPGQKVKLAPVVPGGKPIIGTVRAIAPLVDPASRNGIAHVRFPIDPTLKAGMFVSGDLIFAETESLAVPENAVVFKDGSAVVFVLAEPGKVQQRKIETGLRSDGVIAVRSGLEAGEQVVTSGTGFLSDGDRVNVAENLGR
jgi:HlyD family secretion protein